MNKPMCISRSFQALLALWLLSLPAQAQPAPALPGRPTLQSAPLEELRQELQRLLGGQLGTPRPRSGAPASDPIGARVRELGAIIQQRVSARLLAEIERQFGPVPGEQRESIPLEALDSKGRVSEIPVTVLTRPLRRLTVPAISEKAFAVLNTDNVGLALYDVLPKEVAPEEVEVFRRVYTGEDARALATEAKVVVALKGGEWREPQPGRLAANAVAVRGLDLDKGSVPNGNTTYDDTLYLVVEGGPDPEVYEYRMTTESSSASRGVGRLDAKQVTYVRGLHKGKDPAFRLKDDSAEGTRQGLEGTYRILGANLHSAYSRRAIDSDTPLSPKVSLGCQVVAAGKKAFERDLVFLLDGKAIKEFPYTIVEGDELAVLDQALTQRQKHSLLLHGVPRMKAAV